MADLVGQTVAGYPLAKLLGEGSYSLTFEGTTSAEPVAIKLLCEPLRGDKELGAAIQKGWEKAAAVTHPHLVNMMSSGLDAEWGAYALEELLNVQSLRKWMTKGIEVAWRDALEISTQMAHGLQALHEAGFVHGDLWPSNVLITLDQEVKLEGAGGLVDLPRPVQTVVAGSAVGYLAPERLRGAQATPATDLFGLGGCIYYMLTAQDPVPGNEAEQLVQAVVSGVVVPVSQLRDGLPPEADELVKRLLAKDPLQRYGKVDDVLEALAELKAGRPLPPLKGGQAAVIPERVAPAAPVPPPTTDSQRAARVAKGPAVFGNLDTQVGSTIPKSPKEKEGDDCYRRQMLPQAMTAWRAAWEGGAQHPGLRAKLDLGEVELRKRRFADALNEARFGMEGGQFEEALGRLREALSLADSDHQREEAHKLEEQAQDLQQAARKKKTLALVIALVVIIILVLAGVWIFTGGAGLLGKSNSASPP